MQLGLWPVQQHQSASGQSGSRWVTEGIAGDDGWCERLLHGV